LASAGGDLEYSTSTTKWHYSGYVGGGRLIGGAGGHHLFSQLPFWMVFPKQHCTAMV